MSRYAPEAFRQSRRYANAKRGQRPQLPLRAIDRRSRYAIASDIFPIPNSQFPIPNS
ncbi:MAG: hypothetical protein F6K26_02310 [Moorea sp. SIO2I5]|nr:hypothetical protein [Moorena sp. SIO2I5]